MAIYNPMSEDQTSKFYYVYILLCSDGQLYTGCSGNLKDRYSRHQRGEVFSTKDKRPLKLLWCGAFPDRTFAFAFEKYLKSGSGRAFARKRLIEIK